MKSLTVKNTQNSEKKTLDLSQNVRIHHHRLDKEFSIIANHGVQNSNLSWDTKGLLWYMLSRDSSFEIHTWHLASLYKGEKRGSGIKAIRRMLNELQEEGYLIYKKFKNNQGQWQHRYDIFPVPHSDFQKMFPHSLEGNTAEGNTVKGDVLPKTELPIIELPKESIENTGIVHNSAQCNEDSIGSSIPPSASAAQASIPSKEDKTPNLDSPELLELISLEPLYINYLRPSVVCGWLKKYGCTIVLENIKLLLKVLKTQKKPIANTEAWMEAALIKNYAEASDRIIQNKRFAENLRKKYNIRSLKINKRYCQDTISGKDFYYTLPSENFKNMLINCFKNG